MAPRAGHGRWCRYRTPVHQPEMDRRGIDVIAGGGCNTQERRIYRNNVSVCFITDIREDFFGRQRMHAYKHGGRLNKL